MNDLTNAQDAADACCGENAPNLSKLTELNVLEIRKDFLLNVAYNGKRSHELIIIVLQYMTQFCNPMAGISG